MDIVVLLMNEERNGIPVGAVVAITPADDRMRGTPSCHGPGQSAVVVTDVPDDVDLADLRERFLSPLWDEETGDILGSRTLVVELSELSNPMRNALDKTSPNRALKTSWSTAARVVKVWDFVLGERRSLEQAMGRAP